MAAALKQEMAIMAESQTAAPGENSCGGGGVGDGVVLGDLEQRQRIDVGHVHRHVDRADGDDAEHHGERDIAARFFHFSRDPGDVNPSVVSPEDGDQATPMAEMSWPGESPMVSCRRGELKCVQLPLPMANPRTRRPPWR